MRKNKRQIKRLKRKRGRWTVESERGNKLSKWSERRNRIKTEIRENRQEEE